MPDYDLLEYTGGIWEDLTDTVSGAVDWGTTWVEDGVNDVVETVNDWVDEWVYDSGEGEAVAEGAVSGFIDDYIYDASDEEALIESWASDVWDWGADVVENNVAPIVDDIMSGLDHFTGQVSDDDYRLDDYLSHTVMGNDSPVVVDSEESVEETIMTSSGAAPRPGRSRTEVTGGLLSPLHDILQSVVDNIADRIEAWLANALGYEEKGE